MTNFEIRMTGPTTWEVIVGGKKLDGVREATFHVGVDSIPTLSLEMLACKGTVAGKALTELVERRPVDE